MSGGEQSLGYHQEIETKREWKVAKNEIPGFKPSDHAGRVRQKVHLMVNGPEFLKTAAKATIGNLR